MNTINLKTSRITQSHEDAIAFLSLNKPRSSANVLDIKFFAELNEHLDLIEQDSAIKGVILHSAKPAIFVAGADLNAFNKQTLDPDALKEMIQMGQSAFNRVKSLQATTVAAIHGVCLGGGLELALACDYRIVSHASATKLGLPEVKLGILPAWGGSTRLPRLIGLPKALAAILSGKVYSAKQAVRIGMADHAVHKENLLERSRSLAAKTKPKSRKLPLLFPYSMHSALGKRLIAHKARVDLLKKTRGHYPAPLEALDVIVNGLGEPEERALVREQDGFLKLIQTDTCKNLVNIFFLQERSKKQHIKSEQESLPVNKTMVLGAGVMGAGITQWLSSKKIPVIWKEIDGAQLARGLRQVESIFKNGVRRRKFTALQAQQGLDRITPIAKEIPLKQVDLVIEAIVEKLDIKQAVLKQLETQISPSTVLATNTSALSLTAMGEGLTHPERLVGIHFFNPVHRMQLVEIVQGESTSDYAMATALQFVKSIGKLPVVVQDSPGFLVNRILMPYLMEAVQLLDEGHSISDIDSAMLDFGMPMGPLRLIDEVGLDVAQHVAKDLCQRLPHLDSPSTTLQTLLDSKHLGRKSGSGFYCYHDNGKTSAHAAAILNPTTVFEPSSSESLAERMVLAMVNEAARCLEEKVVRTPEDVDFGMILGTGWAPFRGGPLRYADRIGADSIVKKLHTLEQAHGALFRPAAHLEKLAHTQRGFYPKPRA